MFRSCSFALTLFHNNKTKEMLCAQPRNIQDLPFYNCSDAFVPESNVDFNNFDTRGMIENLELN